MKIKNVAIFGVMAAIINASISAAYADGTVIASQAYVDAKDNLKQNILNVNDTTGNIRTTGSGNVLTGVSSTTDANGQGIVTFTKGNVDVTAAVDDGANGTETAEQLTGTTDKAPSTRAVKSMVVTALTNADDHHVPTTKLVSTELDKKVNKNQGSTNKDKIFVTDSEGKQALVDPGDNLALEGGKLSITGLGSAAFVNKGANTASSSANSLVTVNSDGFVTGTATAGSLAKKSTIADGDVATSANIASTKLQVGTGYAKQSGNIATSDTVQTALGKLEEKADNAKSTADGINNKIAIQGDYTTGWWNTDVVNTTNDNTYKSNLGDAVSRDKDGYIPTVKAVETYIQTQIEAKALDPSFYAAYDTWVSKGRQTSGGDWETLQALITGNGDKTHNVVSDYAQGHQQIIPRNRNIQNGIAYLKGNGIEHYTAGVQNSSAENVGLQNKNVLQAADAAWSANIDDKDGAADDYVPTVASVERRVQKSVEDLNLGSLATLSEVGSSQITDSSIMDADVNSSAGIKATKLKVNTGYTTTGVSGNVAVNDTVQQALAKIEKKADDAATAATNAVTTLDDTASLTASSSDGSWLLNTEGSAGNKTDEAATTHAVAATAAQIKNYVDYKASGSLARKSAVGSSEITNDSIMNVDINSNANIAFTKMDNKLQAIDSSSEANCTPNLPCMLTFYKIGDNKYYKWTSLDLESTNDHAVPNS